MSIKSMHFKSEKAEELLSVLVLQHKQNGKYSFAIPEFPVMKESYVHSMEEKWKMIHKQQRDAHFEEVKDYTISSDFENQDYLPWRVFYRLRSSPEMEELLPVTQHPSVLFLYNMKHF